MHIIVGIDPGKTSAIAAVSLDGRLLYSSHRRFAGIEWLVSEIQAVGVPVIIAGDRPSVSLIVRKVNAIFNSRLFCPSRELSAEEKRGIAKITYIKNPHERDAYAAAIKAYRAYANKFNQAEHIANEMRVEDVDRIKARIVDKQSISEAIANRKANRR
jgi:hypothetical protein